MKKIIALLMCALIVFMGACSSSKSSGSDTSKKSSGKKITLTYANWNLGTAKEQNVERLMIKAYEKAHPNVHIKIDNAIDTTKWDASLTTAASAGKLPDVFMMDQVPLAISNGWLLNLNDLTAKDSDFAKVPKKVVEGVTYNSKLYALPFAQHFLGYFVNEDLFDKANLDYPQYGASLDEFTNAVKKVTDINNGVVGLNDGGSIPDWYPAAANKDMGYYTFNNGKYDLNSKAFIDGVNLTKMFVTNSYIFGNLTDKQKSNFKGGKDGEKAWEQGGIALKWDGTWSVGNMNKLVDFNWDFIGIPGGRTVVTNDYIGISSTTKNPKAAYAFAKWMSFGKQGFMKRIALSKQKGVALNTLPIMNDQDLKDKYFAMNDVPGLKKAYDHLDNAIVEPPKIIPGYVDARWNAPTGVTIGSIKNATTGQLIDAATKGQIKIEDYAKQLNQLANKTYQDAEKKVEAKTK